MAKKTNFDWQALIIAILFTVAAFLSFLLPGSALFVLIVFIGILAIVFGIYRIVQFFRLVYLPGYARAFLMVSGILSALVGVLFLVNRGGAVIALGALFAIWFIVDAIVGLANWKYAKMVGNGYFALMLALNILALIFGILLLISPVVSALTLTFLVGFAFAIFAIENYVFAFTGTKK